MKTLSRSGWMSSSSCSIRPVVVVGERLEHGEAGFGLAGAVLVPHVDHFARGVLAVDEGALEREVDEAGDDAALPDRDMAKDERHAARRLEHFQRRADPRVGLVHLVEEEDAGDALLFQRLQDDLEGRDLLLVGLGHHDSEVDRRQDRLGLEGELDRARAIEERSAGRP